jgi:hypothetical protein
MMCSTGVPRKGSTGEFTAKRVNAFIREIGCEFVTVIIKSDQEPAIQALLEDVRRLRGEVKTIIELSPVGESASNGVVERGIQAMQGQLRTMRSALETCWGYQIPDDHAIINWMVEHSSVVLNKCEVGHDGKTPHERLKVKKTFILTLEFSEKVHFRHNPAGGALRNFLCCGMMVFIWDSVLRVASALSAPLLVLNLPGTFTESLKS